ncbi:hypothetical protein NMY22_g9016 [Coprinellus aureogranulatus]|nr:hypothetical protein NMY22_g9016 [Coprinellus aureogranulatus]
MKDSKMEVREIDVPHVEHLVKQLFIMEDYWDSGAEEARARQDTEGSSSSSAPIPEHSPWYMWYKRVATGTTAVRETIADGRIPNARLMAWNPKKSWDPDNLFFRSLDTCRLLPMDCAVFRIQMYASTCTWQYLEDIGKDNERRKKDGERRIGFDTYKDMFLLTMMHEILVARCFHDRGGADIPIIMVHWNKAQMDAACTYWRELSKGEWTEEEKLEKYKDLGFYLQRSGARPALEEVDRVLRALVHDPAVGYVPPFTILFNVLQDEKARFIFTRPEFEIPQSLMHDIPQCCNAPGCVDRDCGAFDWEKSFSFAKGSPLVREPIFSNSVKCNLWPCNNEEPRSRDGSRVTATRCWIGTTINESARSPPPLEMTSEWNGSLFVLAFDSVSEYSSISFMIFFASHLVQSMSSRTNIPSHYLRLNLSPWGPPDNVHLVSHLLLPHDSLSLNWFMALMYGDDLSCNFPLYDDREFAAALRSRKQTRRDCAKSRSPRLHPQHQCDITVRSTGFILAQTTTLSNP